ncbi:hypothetical protein T265_05259 [Opisthorchis viverrini]|uniref:Uncharacterized protein n=1 Tax=Opisthorchis viverrini TaxID=6198 RepID=A0A074ZWQ3_OPIVI|nr:hypothetical protein T265_05259 [Opisthorchis viverrini]KER27770.1 hypothetical protein T265_05259 [Opisthorchis viverrini]
MFLVVSLFVELGNLVANVSSPNEVTSSARSSHLFSRGNLDLFPSAFKIVRMYLFGHRTKPMSLRSTKRFHIYRQLKLSFSKYTRALLIVDQVAVDLFADLGNWFASVSSP